MVMKTYVHNWAMPDRVAYEYYIVDDIMRRRKPVTRHRAMSHIKRNGLVETYRSEDGVIWDTPNREFYFRYRGFPSHRRLWNEVERIWDE